MLLSHSSKRSLTEQKIVNRCADTKRCFYKNLETSEET